MNIFVLDRDPIKAAAYHANIHVPKMVVETAQLLSTYHPVTTQGIYKHTHFNHPCAKWVRQSPHNYKWLLNLGFALSHEYTRRYNKTHKTHAILEELLSLFTNNIGGYSLMTPLALAMPDEFKVSCPVESYRSYYKHKAKSMSMVWTFGKPNWWE